MTTGFFGYAADSATPARPAPDGLPIRDQLARIGFHAGWPFDLAEVDDDNLRNAFEQAVPAAQKSNWLPAPEGSFNLCARLYYPQPEVLDGTWAPALARGTRKLGESAAEAVVTWRARRLRPRGPSRAAPLRAFASRPEARIATRAGAR